MMWVIPSHARTPPICTEQFGNCIQKAKANDTCNCYRPKSRFSYGHSNLFPDSSMEVHSVLSSCLNGIINEIPITGLQSLQL